MAIPAASGYPQLSGTLIPPMFNPDLIERFHASTVFGEISNTDYQGTLKKCGDQITFLRAPRVTVRKNVKDGTIKHDTLSTCSVTMTVDKLLEFSVKISQVDVAQICNWSTWQTSILAAANQSMLEAIDPELLCQIALEASSANKGSKAGAKSGMYDLGQVGAPLAVTSENVFEVLLNRAQAVCKEATLPMNELYIVLPDPMLYVLQSSPRISMNPGLAGACCDIAKDVVTNGKIPAKLSGFDVYISSNVCSSFDPSAQVTCYDVIFGWKGATAFAAQIEKTRVIETDKDSWDTYLQGLMTYGQKVLVPEGVGRAYIRIS